MENSKSDLCICLYAFMKHRISKCARVLSRFSWQENETRPDGKNCCKVAIAVPYSTLLPDDLLSKHEIKSRLF